MTFISGIILKRFGFSLKIFLRLIDRTVIAHIIMPELSIAQLVGIYISLLCFVFCILSFVFCVLCFVSTYIKVNLKRLIEGAA